MHDISKTECCCKVADQLYFVCQNRNIFYSVDMKSNECKIVGAIPDEAYDSFRLVGDINGSGEELVFAPGRGQYVWIFNLLDNNWKKIKIRDEEMAGDVRFLSSCIHGKKLYMFGCYYPAIVVVDLDDGTVSYDKEVLSHLTEIANEKKESYFRKDFVKEEGKVYLASCLNNQILEYDLDGGSYLWHTVGDKYDRFSGIAYDGCSFWISSRVQGKILKWDKHGFLTYLLNKGGKCSLPAFTGILTDKDGCVLVPNMNYGASFKKKKNEEVFYEMDSREYFFYKIIEDVIVKVDRKGEITYVKDDVENTIVVNKEDKKIIEFLKLNSKKYLNVKSLYAETELELPEFMDLI